MNTFTRVSCALVIGASSIAANAVPSAQAPRYRVTQVASPAAADPACLPGHAVRNGPWGINDLGVVAADYSCYIVGPFAPVVLTAKGFIWSPWSGPVAVPPPANNLGTHAQSVNNLGQVFGRELDLNGSAFGFEWAPYGSYQRTFVAPAGCSSIDAAVAGNTSGYSIAYGLRPDTASGCAVKWLIRAPWGVISEGPTGGQPWDINSRNVAVGDAGSNAVRFHVLSGRTQVLFTGNATTFGRAQDINEDGEVAGYLSQSNKFCGQASAVSWDRDGRQQSLPHLPGQVSSRAHAVGDDEVVGQSGPGLYCEQPYSENERAVIWKYRHATDLNTLIPGSLGITLTRAMGVNRQGQIVAFGYRNTEPLAECPILTWDENDNPILDYTPKCRNFHAFVLTPIR
jgi:uncharacterized membrane protein